MSAYNIYMKNTNAPTLVFSLIASLLLGFGLLGLGQEMLRNPDFAQEFDDGTNWRVVLHNEYRNAGATPATIIRGKGKAYTQAKVDIKSAAHYYSINQKVECENEITYRCTLEARTLGEGAIRIALHDGALNRNAGMGTNLKTDKTWRRFEIVFTPTKVSEEEIPSFHVGFGATKGISQVRNLSLQKVDQDPVKRTMTKEIPLPGAAPSVDLADLLAEFEVDAATAAAKYKDKAVQISAPVTSVTRGPTAGTYLFTLAFGKVKVVGNGADLGADTIKQLPAALKAGHAKAAAMQRSPKWKSFTAEERKGHMTGAYPTLHAGAFVSAFKGGVLQCGRSQDLAVTFP